MEKEYALQADIEEAAEIVEERKSALQEAMDERERLIRAARYADPRPPVRLLARWTHLSQQRITQILAD